MRAPADYRRATTPSTGLLLKVHQSNYRVVGFTRSVGVAELAAAVLKACDDGPYTGELPPLWDGHAGPRIARIITAWLDPEDRR